MFNFWTAFPEAFFPKVGHAVIRPKADHADEGAFAGKTAQGRSAVLDAGLNSNLWKEQVAANILRVTSLSRMVAIHCNRDGASFLLVG